MPYQQSIEAWLEFTRRSPHEFSIQYPPRAEFFMENYAVGPQQSILAPEVVPELLYVHIPFCRTKCAYCFFATDQRTDPQLMDSYLQAILKQIEAISTRQPNAIRCMDVGGGTPTSLSTQQLEKLLARLSRLGVCDAPNARSIETTPRELCATPDKARIIRDYGFDRISMGVQTSNPSVLGIAGREQAWRHVTSATDLIRNANFRRLSMDLIFGLPGQTVLDWQNDITRVANLQPDSITTYDCLYRGTGHQLIGSIKTPPALELLEEMYDWAYAYLSARGYHADYGSVNYSLHPGETGTSQYFERRLLWGDAYIGVGNYATSLLGCHWAFNYRDLNRYIATVLTGDQPIEYHYILPLAERYAKYALFSLNYGVLTPDRFFQLFGCSLDSVYGAELAFAEKMGWIIRHPDRITMAVGRFSNIYALRSLLYSPAAKKWFREWCQE